MVLPDLGCFYLPVFNRIDSSLASLHRYKVDRNAGIHMFEVYVLFFEPLADFSEGEGDVRISRILFCLYFFSYTRPYEHYDDVIAVQLAQICAVSLQRAWHRRQSFDAFREVLPYQLNDRRAGRRYERRAPMIVHVQVERLRYQSRAYRSL